MNSQRPRHSSLPRPLEPLIRSPWALKWLRRLGVAFSLLLILAAVGIAWAFETGRAADALRSRMLSELKHRCGVDAEFSAFRVTALSREVELEDLRLTSDNGELLLAVEEAIVSIQLAPMFYGRIQLGRVALLAPEATLVFEDGVIANVPACVQPAPVPRPSRPTLPLALGVSELAIERGTVRIRHGDDVSVDLNDIGVSVDRAGSGGARVAVGVDDVKVMLDDRSLTIQRFRLLGRLEGLLTQPRALTVEALEVVAEKRMRIEGRGSVDLVGPVFDVRFGVDVPLDLLPRYVPRAPTISGNVGLRVHLTGQPSDPRARGELDLEDIQVDAYGPFDAARLTFVVDRSGLDVLNLDVRHGGRVRGSARLRFEEGLPFEASVEAERLSLARLLHALNVPHPWVDFRGSGPTSVRGTLAPVNLEGPFDFQVDDLVVYDRGFDAPEVANLGRDEVPEQYVLLRSLPSRVTGRWRFEPRGLHFRESEVVADGSFGQVNADIGFAQRPHRVEVSFQPLDFRDVGPIAGVRFEGDGAVQGELRITPGQKPEGDARLDLSGFTIEDIPFGWVRGGLAYRRGKQLDFNQVKGLLGESKYTGRAQVTIEPGTPVDLDLEVLEGRVEDLIIPFGLRDDDWGRPTGAFTGSGQLAGPLLSLTGPIEFKGRGLAVAGESIQSVDCGLDLDQGAIRVRRFVARKGQAEVVGLGGYDPKSKRMSVHAWTRKGRLTDIDYIADAFPALTGGLDVDLRLEGAVGSSEGRYVVDLRDVRVGELLLGDAQVEGPIRGTELSVGAQLFSGQGRASGTVDLTPGYPYDLRFEATELPAITAFATLAGRSFSGVVGGQGRLAGRIDRWATTRGEVDLRLLHLEGFGLTLDAPRPARLTIERGTVETERLELVGAASEVIASGAVGPRTVDVSLDGQLDLSILETFVPQLEQSSGSLEIDAGLNGDWSGVSMVGRASLRRGFVQVSWVEEAIKDLEADFTFSQRSILLERSRSRWAGGQVTARGRTTVGTDGLTGMAVNVEIDDARPRILLPAADATGEVDAVLRLTGGPARFRLSGRIDAGRALLEPKVELRDLVNYRSPPTAYDPRAEILDVDVLVRSGDPIRVKSDAVDFGLVGDLRLSGTNERPGILGSTRVQSRGRVNFLGRNYTFESGTIDFRDRYAFGPRYDLSLLAEVCEARVNVRIDGTLESFDTVYSSSPEMDQRDIISCLLRGIRVSDIDDQRAGGAFAGNTLLKLSGVDQEVKKVLPVDAIDVTTEFSSQAREYQPYVLVAKDLNFLASSARLEYSTSLLQTDDQRAALRVRLTPGLNLQLGWTSSIDVPLGDWGLDLKYRWEF